MTVKSQLTEIDKPQRTHKPKKIRNISFVLMKTNAAGQPEVMPEDVTQEEMGVRTVKQTVFVDGSMTVELTNPNLYAIFLT